MPKKKKGGKKESDGPAVAADEVDVEIAHEVPQAATASAASDSMAPSAKSAALAALTAPDSAPMDRQKAAELWNAMQELAMSRQKPPKKDHQFWNTQPVPQMDEVPKGPGEEKAGEIVTKTVAEVRQEPYNLPPNFEWTSCDMTDKDVVSEVYNLLNENYVEDDDNMFRFDYSREFLNWALTPPGFKRDLHLGVRASSGKKKLVGFITGIPADMTVDGAERKMVEINFLCVHKKLRSKRLAPVLIKEITRRTNMMGVWQAVYTAGVVLPKPVAQNRYYHRSLNPKKLIEVGFSRLQKRMTMARTQKLYRVAQEPQVPGMRAMEMRDVPACRKMLMAYMKKFRLHQNFHTDAEFAHMFLPREGVVNSYVVEDPASKKITDMCSFYTLPSTIIGNDLHSQLRAAYSFYNVANKTSWNDLMGDALILAKQLEFDVFNALNVMENDRFLSELKFGIGDGNLQYYLYNWRCKQQMEPKEVGLVLL